MQPIASAPERRSISTEFVKDGRTKLAVDLVGSRIVNVIGMGSRCILNMETDGGLLIRGDVTGEPLIVRNGALVVVESGWLRGRVEVYGDAIIDGQFGTEDPGELCEIVVHGTIHITPNARIFGNVSCGLLQTEPGCQINCMIKML